MDNRTIEEVRNNEAKLINEIKELKNINDKLSSALTSAERKNQKYKEVIDKAIKILDNYQNNLYSKSDREFLDDDIERSITILKEVE